MSDLPIRTGDEVIYVDYAKRRYDAAILEIERLKQSEFPYAHIRDALLQLEAVFRNQRTQLDKLTGKSTPAIAKNACSQSLGYLFNYTPFLGFILRATNVRNAFELLRASTIIEALLITIIEGRRCA